MPNSHRGKRYPERERGGRERKGLNAVTVEHPHPCKRRNYSNYIARVLRQRFFLSLPRLPPFFRFCSPFSLFSSFAPFSSLSLSPFFPFLRLLVHDSQITRFCRHGSSLYQRSRIYRFSSFSLTYRKISILLTRKAITINFIFFF